MTTGIGNEFDPGDPPEIHAERKREQQPPPTDLWERIEKLAESIVDALPGLGDTAWLAKRVGLIAPFLAAELSRVQAAAADDALLRLEHDWNDELRQARLEEAKWWDEHCGFPGRGGVDREKRLAELMKETI